MVRLCWSNWQTENFGRGGTEGDAVLAFAQYGGNYRENYANSSSFRPPDDEHPQPEIWLEVYTGPQPARDSALAPETIVHEYTHGLSYALVQGVMEDRQPRGLGEGWSDFYALALLSGPYVGSDSEFGWSNPKLTLNPGEGALIFAQNALAVTFVGAVPQGSLNNPFPAGSSMRSSILPKSGPLDTGLGFPVAEDDVVWRYDNALGNYVGCMYQFGSWGAAAPVPRVGESLWISTGSARSWPTPFRLWR